MIQRSKNTNVYWWQESWTNSAMTALEVIAARLGICVGKWEVASECQE